MKKHQSTANSSSQRNGSPGSGPATAAVPPQSAAPAAAVPPPAAAAPPPPPPPPAVPPAPPVRPAPSITYAAPASGFRAPAEELTRAIARHWKVAALVAAAVTLLAWLAAAVQPKRYRATSIAAVAPVATTQLSSADLIRGVDTLERRVIVSSLAALAAAPVTHRQTRAEADYSIVAAVMPNTNLFRIEVEGPNAARAAAIANQVPTILGLQAQSMYRLYGVSLVSEASAPREAALPRMGRAVAAGLVLGVLLGVATAWLLDRRLLR